MPGDSTSNQLVHIYNTFCWTLGEVKEVRAFFCDVIQAFDRVWVLFWHSSCVCLWQASYLSISIGCLVKLVPNINGIEFVCLCSYRSQSPFSACASKGIQLIVGPICNNFEKNRAFYDKSMKLGTWLVDNKTKKLRVSATPKMSSNGRHLVFSKMAAFFNLFILISLFICKHHVFFS